MKGSRSAAIVALGCLPLYPALAQGGAGFGWLDGVALFVGIAAVSIELLADEQMHAFAHHKQPGELSRLFFRAAGFLICVLVGILTAISAWLIELSVDLLGSLRFGYCESDWRQIDRRCPRDDFITWSSFFSDNPHSKFLFFSYVFVGAGFAGFSAWLVQRFAPRASGSGIPEIKTILGGFILKGAQNGLDGCVVL